MEANDRHEKKEEANVISCWLSVASRSLRRGEELCCRQAVLVQRVEVSLA